jgi:uncharacterized membrane protein
MRRTAINLGTLLCFGVAAYAVYAYTALPLGSAVHPRMRAAFEAHSLRVFVHVFSSALALVLGPLQFVEVVRRRRTLHRRLGYAYIAGVGVGGTSGLVTSTIATGGLVSKVGFALLAVAWLFTGLMALLSAKRLDFDEHRRWALRSIALTFAAVTLRMYLGMFFISGIPFENFYPLLAWLCWVPNLFVVEWVVLRAGSSGRMEDSRVQ